MDMQFWILDYFLLWIVLLLACENNIMWRFPDPGTIKFLYGFDVLYSIHWQPDLFGLASC